MTSEFWNSPENRPEYGSGSPELDREGEGRCASYLELREVESEVGQWYPVAMTARGGVDGSPELLCGGGGNPRDGGGVSRLRLGFRGGGVADVEESPFIGAGWGTDA